MKKALAFLLSVLLLLSLVGCGGDADNRYADLPLEEFLVGRWDVVEVNIAEDTGRWNPWDSYEGYLGGLAFLPDGTLIMVFRDYRFFTVGGDLFAYNPSHINIESVDIERFAQEAREDQGDYFDSLSGSMWFYSDFRAVGDVLEFPSWDGVWQFQRIDSVIGGGDDSFPLAGIWIRTGGSDSGSRMVFLADGTRGLYDHDTTWGVDSVRGNVVYLFAYGDVEGELVVERQGNNQIRVEVVDLFGDSGFELILSRGEL
ncbi:MAG: hypothetical protein FWE08_04740 [Oscillospiraceae bacterium]|nr:hypothetical protein [Oscillospiraceae bacterium]